MYASRASLGPVDLAFTDRFGGASGVPYDSLNLGINTADDPGTVAENLARVLDDFAPGAAWHDMDQVHGARVVVVDDADHPGPRTRCDALVTRLEELVLVVRVADCVPVLLADPVEGVIGVAHAGRPGLAAGIVPATVERMRGLGAERLTAWVGPHVCGACYEVPADLQREVGAVVPEAVATTSWGTPSLDIGAGVRAQLDTLEVEVVDRSRCTREAEDLYSYRRDGAAAGRFAGLIRLRR